MSGYNKTKEKQYNFWQNEFEHHDNYMLKGKEYDKIREMMMSLVDGHSFLDVGCASGGTYDFIEKRHVSGFEYKGVDYCEKFIEANKKRKPEVKWEVQDARTLREGDESWDALLYYDSLDMLNGWENAIDEAMRVAKKQIVIVTWKEPNPEKFVRRMVDNDWFVEFLMVPKKELGMSTHWFIFASKIFKIINKEMDYEI